MPTYKDEKTGTWYCKFYYTNYTGVRKQKLKRGFKLQRDAKEWERTFLEHQAGSPDMPFKILYDLYMEDMSHRLKPSTLRTKKARAQNHILPYFSEKPINKVTVSDIRRWQQDIIEKDLKPTVQRDIHAQCSAIFNYAMKFYNLPKNPCLLAGSIGSNKAAEKQFWTKQEFDTFISAVENPMYKTLFYVLFYTGLRIGEALALTPEDIDLQHNTITVSKTYYRGEGQHQILTPKTANSNRVVQIPEFLTAILQKYMNSIYDLQKNEQLFFVAQTNVRQAMKKACNATGVKYIRVHGLRHSHVSMLIHMGFPVMLIAERIGDTVKMVNEVYGHLYPTRHEEVAQRLNDLVSM